MAAQNGNPWLAGTEAMMKSWSEAQKLMWAPWSDLAKGQGEGDPFAGATTEWRRLAEASLKGWQGDALTGSVAERMMAGQGLFTGLLEHAAEAWQAVLPHLEGGDWQGTLQQYTEAMRAQLTELPANLLGTSLESGELWSRYLGEWQKLGQLWLEPDSLQAGGEAQGEVTRLIDRFWSAFDKTLGRAIQSPTIGYSREFNAKLLAGYSAWLEVRRTDADYQTILGELWLKAFDAMMKRLVERSQEGQPPSSAKELLSLWISTADEVFVREFATPRYIEAQGKLLNASMAHRLRERAVMEAFMDAYGLPTRTELDQTQEALYDLRREVRGLRSLKKELDALRSAQQDGADLAELKAELAALREALEEAQGSAPRLEANLPLENYGALSVADVTEKLGELSRYEIEQIRLFELLHKNRKTLLAELDRRLQEGA